ANGGWQRFDMTTDYRLVIGVTHLMLWPGTPAAARQPVTGSVIPPLAEGLIATGHSSGEFVSPPYGWSRRCKMFRFRPLGAGARPSAPRQFFLFSPRRDRPLPARSTASTPRASRRSPPSITPR